MSPSCNSQAALNTRTVIKQVTLQAAANHAAEATPWLEGCTPDLKCITGWPSHLLRPKIPTQGVGWKAYNKWMLNDTPGE